MIDTILVNRAKSINPIVIEIDNSWRTYFNKTKENTVSIPFKDNYNAIIKENFILVEGYSGLLSIEKIYLKPRMYKIITPLRYYPYKIYGIFDKGGNFNGLTSEPLFGFHYNSSHFAGILICTGDLKFNDPKTKEELSKICNDLIAVFKIINLNSLGDIKIPFYLPERFKYFDNISKLDIDNLITQGVIEKIDYFGDENDK